MKRVKDPDTVLRIALRCDELHHQGKTVEDIIDTVLSEGYTRKNGAAINRHHVLSAMYRLCGWYVPSKGRLREARKDVAPELGHHRKKSTRPYRIRRDPPKVVDYKHSFIVGLGVFLAMIILFLATR